MNDQERYDEMIKILGEMAPEVLAKFEEQYEDVKMYPWDQFQGVHRCDRCEGMSTNKDRHTTWHKGVSLALWLVQSWSLEHASHHQEWALGMAEAVTEVLQGG